MVDIFYTLCIVFVTCWMHYIFRYYVAIITLYIVLVTQYIYLIHNVYNNISYIAHTDFDALRLCSHKTFRSKNFFSSVTDSPDVEAPDFVSRGTAESLTEYSSALGLRPVVSGTAGMFYQIT